MTPAVDKAITQSLAYAQCFGAPLTFARLRRFLITSHPVSSSAIHLSLHGQKTFVNTFPFYHLSSFDPSRIDDYRLRQTHLPAFIRAARSLAKLLSYCPTIQLVCLTGSVAAGNPRVDDDLDFLIVTSPHSLWLTRLIVNPLFTLFFHRRRPSQDHTTSQTTCLNLWLDSDSLLIPTNKQSLYSAYELAQAIPLFDRGGAHHRLMSINTPWASKHLANAYPFESTPSPATCLPAGKEGRAGERFIKLINNIAFKIQYMYMKPKMTTEYVTLHQAFFHPHSPESKIDTCFKKLSTNN